MLAWEKRPFEIAYSLNPAFLTILLYEAINAFEKKNSVGIPFALIFLVVPMVYYGKIREQLPKNENIRLYQWSTENQVVLIHFSEKVRQLIPYTKESIIFAMQNEIIRINENGNFVSIKNKSRALNKLKWRTNSRTYLIKVQAQFLGKWFAVSGDTETIYRTLGIKL